MWLLSSRIMDSRRLNARLISTSSPTNEVLKGCIFLVEWPSLETNKLTTCFEKSKGIPNMASAARFQKMRSNASHRILQMPQALSEHTPTSGSVHPMQERYFQNQSNSENMGIGLRGIVRCSWPKAPEFKPNDCRKYQ